MIEYSEILTIVSQILITAGMISLVVSLMTEFLIKQFFKLSTKTLNATILGLSEALTILCGVIYIQVNALSVAWYVWVGVVFLGFLVSIISMQGYDKIYSYIYGWIKNIFERNAE